MSAPYWPLGPLSERQGSCGAPTDEGEQGCGDSDTSDTHLEKQGQTLELWAALRGPNSENTVPALGFEQQPSYHLAQHSNPLRRAPPPKHAPKA